MKRNAIRNLLFVTSLAIVLAGCSPKQSDSQSISAADLQQWSFYGIGEKSIDGDVLSFGESEGSKGVMIVSPTAYSENLVVSCEMKANTPDTVLVIALSFSDLGESSSLTVPENYDGAISWLFESENYFFAFHNAPHSRKPFVRKNPVLSGPDALAEHELNVMAHGEWKTVEASIQNGKLALSIGGELLFETQDPAPLKGGYIAIRTRGTATGKANFSMRNLSISAAEVRSADQ